MISRTDYDNPHALAAKVAAELRRLLRQENLRQSDVGKKLDWSQPTTSRFFQGQLHLSYHKLLQVLAVTETAPADFFRPLCPIEKSSGSGLMAWAVISGLGHLLVRKGVITHRELRTIQDDLTRNRNDR